MLTSEWNWVIRQFRYKQRDWERRLQGEHRKAMKTAHGYRPNWDTITAGGRKRDKRQRKWKRDAFSVMERQKIIRMTRESNKTTRETSTKPAQLQERESERETPGKTRNPAVSQSERKRERRVKRKHIQTLEISSTENKPRKRKTKRPGRRRLVSREVKLWGEREKMSAGKIKEREGVNK